MALTGERPDNRQRDGVKAVVLANIGSIYMHKLTLLYEIQLKLLLKLLKKRLELLAAEIGHELLVLLLLVDEHVPLVLLKLLSIGGLLVDELLAQQLLHVLLQRQSLAEQQRVNGCGGCCYRRGGAGDVTGGLQRSDWLLLATCYFSHKSYAYQVAPITIPTHLHI